MQARMLRAPETQAGRVLSASLLVSSQTLATTPGLHEGCVLHWLELAQGRKVKLCPNLCHTHKTGWTSWSDLFKRLIWFPNLHKAPSRDEDYMPNQEGLLQVTRVPSYTQTSLTWPYKGKAKQLDDNAVIRVGGENLDHWGECTGHMRSRGK